jgi:type IX secretion system PorP/SprF family membrane protein
MGQYSPVYSQYYMNGAIINPAYSGSKDALCLNAISRAQWMGLEGAPCTQILSLHAPSASKDMAGGILLTHDKIAITSTTTFSLAYAYRVRLGTGRLSFGLAPGVMVTRNDWNAVTTIESDNLIPSNTSSKRNFIASSGIYYYNNKWFAGVSSPLLLSKSLPNEETLLQEENNPPVFITAGYLLNSSGDIKIKPSVLFKQYSGSNQFDLNMNLYYKNLLGAGVSYRTKESITGMIQCSISRNIKMGYSYDYPVGIVNRFSNGSHEIMFEYIISLKKDAVNPRFF